MIRRLLANVREGVRKVTQGSQGSRSSSARTMDEGGGMSVSGGVTDGRMSRRRLLFLGTASTLGVVFARILNPFKSDVPAASDVQAAPPTHHGATPDTLPPQNGSTVESRVQGTTLMRWSDPRAWNGKVPGPGDVAKIDSPILLDVDGNVAGVIIEPKGSLTFDPNRTRTLTSKGNVIVRGRLIMRPKSASTVHKLLITGASESAFKGGGAIPLASDIGLWVVGDGVLDAVGSAKRGWTRATGSVGKGAKSISLKDTPSGWRPGDEVVITPTGSPASTTHYAAFDTATISSVGGKTISLSKSTSYAHPSVAVGGGKTFTAEVLNLTRNVRIEGRPGHRTHVFINSRKKQIIKYVAVRHVGPRQGNDGVLGRYGIHFHMVGDHSRGSLVEGAVVTSAGHHAYVAHASHGVTFRDCVSHNTMSAAYWWDPGPENVTRDVFYDRCVASKVDTGTAGQFRHAAFGLGFGGSNSAHGCVAVGVTGSKNASGFIWPEPSGSGGKKGDGTGSVWDFVDCVAHNNKVNGIFVWQNNSGESVIDRFVAYHNGKAGIEHGAYKNVYQYRDSILYGNKRAGAMVAAVSGEVQPLAFVNVLFDGAGLSEYGIWFSDHNADPSRPTQVTDCTFRGNKKAAFGVIDSVAHPDHVDAVSCSFNGNQFWLNDKIDQATVVRVQDAKLGSIALRPKGQPGTFHPAWNASVSDIANFA